MKNDADSLQRLAFPKNDARLRGEFQVGVHEPQDLASELERAGKMRAACATHADALAEHGWIAGDTALLADTVALRTGGDDTQEAAKDKKGPHRRAQSRRQRPLQSLPYRAKRRPPRLPPFTTSHKMCGCSFSPAIPGSKDFAISYYSFRPVLGAD